jgi:DNA-directed RNA polymerase subunit K/omega
MDLSIVTSQANEKKITPPIMYTFEKSKIIEKRVDQLNEGYRSTIEDIIKKENITRSDEIALREFELGKLPRYEVKRVLGDGSFELWEHTDFEFFP